MRPLLWTTFLACWLGSHALLDYCSNLMGSSGTGASTGHLLQALNTDTELRTLAFRSQALTCDGRITAWEVYVARPGIFYTLVFRSLGGDSYEVVGRNRIQVDSVEQNRYQIFEVGGSGRIRARAGDFIGIAYDAGTTDAVVYVEESTSTATRKAPRTGPMLSSTLSGKDFTAGEAFPLQEEIATGVVALRALVTDITTYLKLEKGQDKYLTEMEGWASMFRDNTWGKICDNWYDKKGWPTLFCKNLGFPDVEEVRAYDEMSDPGPVNTGPQHHMNIRCKPSQNVTIFTCDKHEWRQCDHNRDIYIKCKPKVRLAKGQGPEDGIPEAFDCGYWGLICDSREPEFHFLNRDKSWVTAFCVNLGYAKFTNIVRATEQDIAGLVIDDTWKNPECDVTVLSQLNECRSLPLSKRNCENQYYKITCGK